jgi:hypothetical protein
MPLRAERHRFTFTSEYGAQSRPGGQADALFYLKLRYFKLLHILQLFCIKFQFGLAYGG